MQHKQYIQRIHSIDMQTKQIQMDGGLNARYVIKCDDCKITIGQTNSMVESAMGGRCEQCKRVI